MQPIQIREKKTNKTHKKQDKQKPNKQTKIKSENPLCFPL